MEAIFGTIIFRPMGWLLNWSYELTGSMGLAILMLTVIVNILLFPLSVRQQRSMAKQTALKPKLDRLREKYADNKQKLSTEMQNLYANEGVSMTGGCLLTLIRLPFLWGIYTVIRSPLTYMLGLGEVASKAMAELTAKGFTIAGDIALWGASNEKGLSDAISKLFENPEYAPLKEGMNSLDFHLFGLDLSATPKITDPSWLWIFPLFSFAMAFLSSWVSMLQNKKNNPEAAKMGGMMYLMPFISLYIAFMVHSALGLYWGFSSIISTLIQIVVNKYYGPYQTLALNYKKTVKTRKDYEVKKKASRSKAKLN